MCHDWNMKLTASLLMASLGAPLMASEQLDLYGKVNVEGAYKSDQVTSETIVQSNASRIGVKGTQDLTPNLAVFYRVEFGVNITSEQTDADALSARNQYVGLSGRWGEWSIGRNDTVLKREQGRVDLFSDLAGDIARYGFEGENRPSQTITYQTPLLGQWQLGATYVAEKATKQDGQQGYSVAIRYGDARYKKVPYFLAVAQDMDVDQQDSITRVTAGGKFHNWTLGVIYQQTRNDEERQDGAVVSLSYRWEQWQLKSQYTELELGADGLSVGIDWHLAKSTKLYGYFTDRSGDHFSGLGLSHSF